MKFRRTQQFRDDFDRLLESNKKDVEEAFPYVVLALQGNDEYHRKYRIKRMEGHPNIWERLPNNASARWLGGSGLRLYRGTPFRGRFAQLLPAGRSVARGEGVAARAIRKDGLARWGVAFSPPFCYTDFRLASYLTSCSP